MMLDYDKAMWMREKDGENEFGGNNVIARSSQCVFGRYWSLFFSFLFL